MSLITAANVQSFTDKFAAVYNLLLAAADTSANLASPVLGTVQSEISLLQTLVLGLNDFEQENDLLLPVNTALGKSPVEKLMGFLQPVLGSLNDHLATRGKEVNASIVDLPSFLTYYNGGSGGSKFANMLTPEMQTIYGVLLNNQTLPVAGVMSPAIQPDYRAAASAHGLADKVVGGSFTAGDAVDTTKYSEVIPVLEVITTITGGTGTISATLTGVDDQGNAATWGPVVLTGGNNPVAALSGITITPAVTAFSRQTVAFSSTTGIVIGSVLTINKGLPDQEVIVVEGVSGSNVTAVFKKAHAGSATVDGWTSTAAGAASTGASRRCRSISAITYTLNGQSAGKVRVAGAQDRVGV